MKKILFFILCLFCFSVNAQELLLDNEIIRFKKIEDYNLQGFTLTDKYIVAFLINEDNNKAIIKAFDINDYHEVNSIKTNSLGHANDATYNKNTNLIYVIRNGNNLINMFDADTLEYRGEVYTELPIRSLAYIPDIDMYAARVVTSGYYLNNDFTVNSSIPFVIGLNIEFDTCRQGWTYYNDHIYYSKWSWIRKGGDGTNHISIYDLNGTQVDELVTRGDIGELEDVDFINDKMILGINRYDNYVTFYLEDIPLIDPLFRGAQEIEIIEEEIEEEEIKETNHELFQKILLALVFIVYIVFLFYSLKVRIKKRLI